MQLGQAALENLNQSASIPNTGRGYTDHSQSPGEALKMKARANLPFKLQSFYHGYPLPEQLFGKCFSSVSARSTITKAVLHCVILVEKWVLKGRGYISVGKFLTYSVYLGGEACTAMPTGEWWRWSQNQLQTNLRQPDEGSYGGNHSLLLPYPVESKKWVIGAVIFAGQIPQRTAPLS